MTIKYPSIILVRPQLPENIGMVARAMNNFGLNDLIVVSPRENWLNNKTINAAKKANSIIKNIKVFSSLEDAISNFTYVIATTNRKRYLEKKSTSDFKYLKNKINTYKKSAILFGPENSGLSNEDLNLADIIFSINTSNQNNSLNLSHAVSILCYKIFELNNLKNNTNLKSKLTYINKSQLSKYFEYLFSNLENRGFFTPKEKKASMKNNIYAIFTKSPLTKKELQTLWGITKKLTK